MSKKWDKFIGLINKLKRVIAERDEYKKQLEELEKILDDHKTEFSEVLGREDNEITPNSNIKEKKNYHLTDKKYKYSYDMIAFLIANKDNDLKELTALFNKEFKLKVKKEVIKNLFKFRKELQGHKYKIRRYEHQTDKPFTKTHKCQNCHENTWSAWYHGKQLCKKCFDLKQKGEVFVRNREKEGKYEDEDITDSEEAEYRKQFNEEYQDGDGDDEE